MINGRRNYTYLLFFIAIFSIGVAAWDYFPNAKPFNGVVGTEPILIAHAGGAINGHIYTNSLEAVEQAITNGFKFIELDLGLTTDKRIVAVHDWQSFHSMTNGSGDQPIEEQEFAARRIFGNFQPLTTQKIKKLFSHPNAPYLVVDKISAFNLLKKELGVPPERMLIEVFSYKKYKQALRAGIVYPMLCIWNKQALAEATPLVISGKVRIITLPVELLTDAEAEIEKLYVAGTTIFVFTTNDAKFVLKHGNKRVTGFYTNILVPKNIAIQHQPEL